MSYTPPVPKVVYIDTILYDSGTTAVTNPTITVPTGAVVGDLMIAQWASRASGDITWPAGWTLIDTLDSTNTGTTANEPTASAAWRIMQSGDTSWTATTTSVASIMGVIALRGHDPFDPIDAYSINESPDGTGATATYTGVTVARANSLLVAHSAGVPATLSPFGPRIFNERWNSGTAAGGAASGVGSTYPVDAGATGDFTGEQVGAATSSGWVTFLVSVQPPVG